MKKCLVLFLLSFLLSSAAIKSQTLYNDVGHIPTQYQESWASAGMFTDATTIAPKQVFVVTDMPGANITAKKDTAIARAQLHVRNTDGLAIIYFPPGEYYLTTPIELDTCQNIIIQGEGSDQTTLVFQDIASSNCIYIHGQHDSWGSATEINQNFNKGDSIFYVASNGLANIDEFQWIHIVNYGFPYLDQNASIEPDIVGQVTQLVDKDTDWGKIKDVANMNFVPAIVPVKIAKIKPAMNIGIENLKIMRSPNTQAYGDAWVYNIKINYAVNCWIKGVESYKPSRSHLAVSCCSHIVVSGCYFHEAMAYGGGGWGYGVVLGESTTNTLVENNIFRYLRHALVSASGSNCNVWTFNYSREQYDSELIPTTRDLDLHAKFPYGHLFEQNLIEEIGADDYHGLNGPFNTFLRNYCYDANVITIKGMANWSFLGNIRDDFSDNKALLFDADYNPIIDLFGYRNSYSTACSHPENYYYGYVCQLADVSYYYSQRPPFLPSSSYTWPALGPETNLTQDIPAHTRYGYSNKTYLEEPTPKPWTTDGAMPYNQTWSTNHTVTGNITIPSGLTLTIKSGVTVTFSGSSYITVQPGGTIIAESGVAFSPSDRSVRYRGAMSTDNT